MSRITPASCLDPQGMRQSLSFSLAKSLTHFPESALNLSHLTRAPFPPDGSHVTKKVDYTWTPWPCLLCTWDAAQLPGHLLSPPPTSNEAGPSSCPGPASLLCAPPSSPTPQPPSLPSPQHFPPMSPSLQHTNILKSPHCHLKFLQSSHKQKSRWLFKYNILC